MGALDTSIVNVCIPDIMADFGSSVDEIEWVITAYMLAFATLMPLTAWLRDRVGHKVLYMGSLTLFTAGSVLCGLAWNLPSLIVARILQALGGGAITPTAMAMISEVFEPRERGKAMGYWGVGVIMGPAFGPTLGGFLTKALGWRSIFLVNLPIGVIGFLMALSILKEDKDHATAKSKFDLSGFLFLSLFLIAFLLGLSKGETEGWTSRYVVVCGILSFFSFIGFMVVESLVPNGIVDISLFKLPIFTACVITTFVRSVALFGGTFLLPLFLEQHMGLDEIDTGLVLLPGALVIGVFMPLAGKFSDRTGPRLPSMIGLVALASFMFLYRNLDPNTSMWDVIWPTLIRGFGLGLLIAPVMASALNSVPLKKAGMASSILNLVQQMGGAIGIAALATVLNHRAHFHISNAAASLQANSPRFLETFKNLSSHLHSLGYSHGQSGQMSQILLAKHVAQTGSVMAFRDAFLVGAVFVIFAVIPAMMLPSEMVHTGAEVVIGE